MSCSSLLGAQLRQSDLKGSCYWPFIEAQLRNGFCVAFESIAGYEGRTAFEDPSIMNSSYSKYLCKRDMMAARLALTHKQASFIKDLNIGTQVNVPLRVDSLVINFP